MQGSVMLRVRPSGAQPLGRGYAAIFFPGTGSLVTCHQRYRHFPLSLQTARRRQCRHGHGRLSPAPHSCRAAAAPGEHTDTTAAASSNAPVIAAPPRCLAIR